MNAYTKPLPTPDLDTKEFWEGCKKHKLMMQKCPQCGYYCFPPYPMCPKCQSMDRKWVQVSGKGKVYCWTIVRRAGHPDFENEVPYALLFVELDEQPQLRMLGNLVGGDMEAIKPNMPVEVVFDDVTDEFTLPKWKPI